MLMSSIREFQNVKLGDGDMGMHTFNTVDSMNQISVLFTEFGVNFKRLLIENCLIKMMDLKALLSDCPNLESLQIKSTCHIEHEYTRQDLPPRLSLEKLKEFSIVFCDSEIHKIGLALTKAKITSFSIISDNTEVLMPLLVKQPKIQKLEIHSYGRALFANLPNVIDKLKLKELSLGINGYPGNEQLMRRIISRQFANLKHVDLTVSMVTDAIFFDLTSCIRLETLKIIVNSVSPMFFRRIVAFKNLKELTVLNNDEKASAVHLQIISEVKNEELTKLEIFYPTKNIDSVDFAQLDDNVPNLKHLVITARITAHLAMKIAANLQALKTLKLSDQQNFQPVVADEWNFMNFNLRELSLDFDARSCIAIVFSLVNSFPDLEKLEIKTSAAASSFDDLMMHIIDSLKSLRELKIFNAVPLELSMEKREFIDMLTFGKNLRLVSFNAARHFTSKNFVGLFGHQFSKIEYNGFRFNLYK